MYRIQNGYSDHTNFSLAHAFYCYIRVMCKLCCLQVVENRNSRICLMYNKFNSLGIKTTNTLTIWNKLMIKYKYFHFDSVLLVFYPDTLSPKIHKSFKSSQFSARVRI